MEFGIGLPTSGQSASPEAILRVAEDAESAGLSTLWTFERLLRPTELGERALPESYATVYDPIESLAFVASRTRRIRLGTSVMDALFHPPVILGRRFATLDRLSNGRVIAGLGQGWMEAEFATAGIPLRRRGAGFEEYIRALRAVWGPDPVSFDGRFYRIAESQIGPKPVQPGGPPILVGAFAAASIERTAAMGLGINPVMFSWEALEGMLRTFRAAAEAAGRDPGLLPVVVRVNGPITEQPLAERQPVTGSPEQVVEDLRRLEAMGVSEVLWSMSDVPPAEQAGRVASVTALV